MPVSPSYLAVANVTVAATGLVVSIAWPILLGTAAAVLATLAAPVRRRTIPSGLTDQ
jgi:hypothetical protein